MKRIRLKSIQKKKHYNLNRDKILERKKQYYEETKKKLETI